MTEEPKATSKHSLCGYAWTDVCSSLQRSIGISDMTRAQRWAAELVCSDLGLGRLEALLFDTWAIHVGSTFPGWPRMWYDTIKQLRALWSKSGGDIKAVRNTPIIRQLVAEAVANLVLVQKRPIPTLPTASDCFRESEAVRSRIRSGGGAGDQLVTRRIWTAQLDGDDLKTIGNELEASIKTNQIHRTLFWVIWFFTLETQKGAPHAKERGPASLPIKQRKSILWFLVELLKELAKDSVYLSADDRNAQFDLLELTWAKLGSKGRKECIVTIALSIQEHIAKKSTLALNTAVPQPDSNAIRSVVSAIDVVYSGIAEEAKKFVLEAPVMVGLTKEGAAQANAITKKPTQFTSKDKLALSYSLLNSS